MPERSRHSASRVRRRSEYVFVGPNDAYSSGRARAAWMFHFSCRSAPAFAEGSLLLYSAAEAFRFARFVRNRSDRVRAAVRLSLWTLTLPAWVHLPEISRLQGSIKPSRHKRGHPLASVSIGELTHAERQLGEQTGSREGDDIRVVQRLARRQLATKKRPEVRLHLLVPHHALRLFLTLASRSTRTGSSMSSSSIMVKCAAGYCANTASIYQTPATLASVHDNDSACLDVSGERN